MSDHHHFHYIELPTTDMAAMKTFYGSVFGWDYIDYGPNYAAITRAGMEGGFDARADREPSDQGALIILYSDNLDASEQAVKDANGIIVQDIFEFPGGRRFHFKDPSGNELAVWTKAEE